MRTAEERRDRRDRRDRRSLTKLFTLSLMGGDHALIDVYDLFLLFRRERERALKQ